MRELTRRQLAVDLGVGVAFVLVCLLAGAINDPRFSVPPLLLFGAALAVRRMVPGLALGLAWLAAFLQLVAEQPPAVYDLAVCGVLFVASAYGGTALRWLGLLSAVGGAGIASWYLILRQGWFGGLDLLHPYLYEGQLRDFSVLGAGILALLVLSWLSGLLARSMRLGRATDVRAQTAAHERDLAEYRVVVEQERNRIARDMHDVVAHSLAVVIAQSDGARFAAATRPEVAVEALGTIAGVARTALGDVRMLLAELRHDEGEAPQPAVADLEALFGQLRGAGLDLTVRESGTRLPLGAGHEIAAYRIVQEGLTNALRHGTPGGAVELTLFWADDGLHLELVNPVPEPAETGADTHTAAIGHGLPGMHERAQLAGGHLSAGPDGAGCFRVRARLPRVAAAPAEPAVSPKGAA